MKDNLYFPNKLKDIKNHIWHYIVSCEIFLQWKVTVSKENMNL